MASPPSTAGEDWVPLRVAETVLQNMHAEAKAEVLEALRKNEEETAEAEERVRSAEDKLQRVTQALEKQKQCTEYATLALNAAREAAQEYKEKTQAQLESVAELNMAHGQTLQQLLQLRNPLQLYLKVRDPDTTPTTGSGSETTSATPVKPRGKAPAPSRSSLQVPTQSPPGPYSYGVKTLYLKGERLHDFHRIFDTSRHEDTRTAWHTMRYLAESALIDQQVVLIAYGQSGSGKTATLYEGHKTGPEKIPSFLDYIGELLFKEHGEQKWSIHATWIEVYGKVMYNLAHPRDKQHPPRKKAANSNTSSDEVEYNRGGAKPLDPGVFPYSSLNDYILYKNTRTSLAPTTLNSADELSKFRKHCLARRHIDGGDANGTSSRGNAVLTLRLFCDGAPRGAIALVDLFGAEEQKAGDVKQKNERGPATNDIETLGKHLQNLSQHKVSPIPPPTIRQSKLLGLLAGILQGDKVMPADGGEQRYKLPKVAVLGHLTRGRELNNKRTVEKLIMWGEKGDLGKGSSKGKGEAKGKEGFGTECALCTTIEREVDRLSEEVRKLEKENAELKR